MQESTTLSLFGTGQITLPKKWRKQFNTKEFIAVLKNKRITLIPIEIEEEYDLADDGEGWETLLDLSDEGGMDMREFSKILKKQIAKESKTKNK